MVKDQETKYGAILYQRGRAINGVGGWGRDTTMLSIMSTEQSYS